ncbi:MAG TPA: UTP--glucose-1-phosphate uridylyltransferase [Anaerolineales bacterium]|nr:UTP--glucose-1-phosphate uridylyltransferase [Anaerolineales bacterium]
MDFNSALEPFTEMMRAENLPDAAIRTFSHYYRQLHAGETGEIPEDAIEPVRDLPSLEDFRGEFTVLGEAAAARTVMIKLNGGLGTSMGMRKAKSLLPVRGDLRFIDIIARHALARGVPLILMNSFATREDSLAALKAYPALWESPVGIDFLQHKFPKILQADLSPAESPGDPALAWNPPGHGDIYAALGSSGTLSRLLDAGFEYAFLSNGDNLGAAMDHDLLGYFAHHKLPFMMEVARRTEAVAKGGHLAVWKGGGYVLRETAQCPAEDMHHFRNPERHPFFNMNNLWVHLPRLLDRLKEREQVLGLPLIRNAKTLDPRDPESPKVFQLETAMGAAIGLFREARAVSVTPDRFAPVKTTDDLLTVRSDAYALTEDFRVVLQRETLPQIDLDPDFYRLIDEFDARFPAGPPSLIECESLKIRGDVAFGGGVVLRGKIEIDNPAGSQIVVPDGAELVGD